MVKFLIGWVLIGLYSSVDGSPKPSTISNHLANVMLKSSYSLEDNPAQIANCFQLYSPKLIDLTEQYQDTYNACLNHTAEEELKLTEKLQGDIDSISEIFGSIHIHFENCSETKNSLIDLLDCYNMAAGFTIQKSYNIQTLSKNKMQYVEISEEYITYNQTLCTDDCYRIYNEESTKTHNDLENCLNGIYGLASSTALPVPVSTTEKPETTQNHVTSSDKADVTIKTKETTVSVTTSEQPQSTTENIQTDQVESRRKFSQPF